MKQVLLAATALGLMATVVVAQEIPVVVLFPGAPPPPADGCGGYGSLAIKWIEEAADAFDKQGATFDSGDKVRQAVMEAAKPKLVAAWSSMGKQAMAAGPSRRVYAPSVMMPKRQDAMDPRCFPKLMRLVAHNEQRLAEQTAAEVARVEAESQRRVEEAAKREAEAAQRAEAERKAAEAERKAAKAEADARLEANRRAAEEQSREAAKPENQLREAYSLYILLKWCHDVRDGYLVQYVNDVEMHRVETAMKAIGDKLKAQDPNMDTDKIWKQADRAIVGKGIGSDSCHWWFRQFMGTSPIPAVRVQKPQ
jgi:hypothetical protein